VKNVERALFITGAILAIAIFLMSLFHTISDNAPILGPPIQFWAVKFLPDGRTIATVGGDGNPYERPKRGELVLWDLKTLKEKLVLRQNSSVRSVAVAPNGRFLATGDFDGCTKLVNPDSGATIAKLKYRAGVNAVVVSPDSGFVVSARLDGTIAIWNVASNTVETLVLSNETALNVAISVSGKALVVTTRSGKAYLFNLLHPETWKVLQAYEGPPIDEPNAEGVAFAPNGRIFATACQNRVRLWNYPDGKLMKEFVESNNVNSIDFAPDGATLATVNSDGRLELWNPVSGKCLLATNAHSGTSFCVTFSRDGKRIATIGRDDYTLKIWGAHTLAPIATMRRDNAPKLTK
jgi:WD40 repeat protein